jgi:cell wall-associated NlpC family hydrolase
MDWLIFYSLSFIGVPYKYSGESPMEGMDCSAFVQEILKSAGAHPKPGVDLTAQGLYDALESSASSGVHQPGAIAFFGKNVLNITHVGFMIDSYRMVEAGGGGSRVVDLKSACENKAYIRVRPIKNRSDLVAVLKPSYSSIGLTR